MPERALKSRSAVSVLNEDFNDIDIYVEDTAVESKKIYAELLSRVFNYQFKIDNVIPLGGCSQVIAEWRENKTNKDDRPKIFLVDGDYHLLNNSLGNHLDSSEITNHKGLFVLPRYCIENYLVDLDSFIEILYEEIATDDRDDIAKKINFKNWIDLNSEILSDLFIYNSICIKYNVSTKTSKFKAAELQSLTPGICCKNLIKTRIDDLKRLIVAKDNKIDIQNEYNARKNILKENDFLVICTGKDYLFPMIKKYISNSYQRINNIGDISLKIRLSKICDIKELSEIQNNVI